MKVLETRIDRHPSFTEIAEARSELERIDRAASRIRVPVNFSDQFYNLRGHIDLVRQRLQSQEVALPRVAAE